MDVYHASRLVREIKLLRECVCRLSQVLMGFPIGVQIFQIKGDTSMSITGIPAGGTGTFESDPIPSSVPFPAGTVDTWSASDPSIIISTTSDPMQVSVGVPAGTSLPMFDLTVSVQMPGSPAPAPLVATVPVPVLPPVVPTGVTINQIA
jgi:hypothetical protein